MELEIGNHVTHRDQPGWGVGRVVARSEDGMRVAVRFPGRPREELQVSTRDPALERHRFQPGEEVKLRADDERIVRGVVRAAVRADLDVLQVEAEGVVRELPERSVAALPPASGVVEALVRGQWGEGRHFALRQSTLRLDVERRCDALGALFASRVMVRPYQVAVAQRVLSDRMPRYVLADEVGLGKTIEAGMILAALLHARLATRVLVVSPAHLCVQWLAELWHKFNLRFSLLDADRLESLAKEAPDEDPWHENALVVTSLELLQRQADIRRAVSSRRNRWDLVVVDEAHHLRGDRAYEAATGLANNTWGMLLLTATPLKLDPVEYYRLLRLVESAPAQTPEEFVRRMERQADLSALVRALEDSAPAEVAQRAAGVAKLFPADKHLAKYAQACAAPGRKGVAARDALLDHVAEVYSLSSRLVRNRRAVVGGFTERRLHRLDVVLDREAETLHREVQDAVHAALKAGTLPQGAPLAMLLRRLDSSPAALASALAARPEKDLAKLAVRARALEGMAHDAKLRALRDRIRDIRRTEPGAKVLVFTESRETLDYLVAELSRAGLSPLQYHGDLPTLDRDRMVARFRDPEGPGLLVSSEAGGEGRNFQFCHHLVHYDLPWSPSAIEQRIGRLDRVGQTRPVEIVVVRPRGTLAARVADLFADDVRVFTETVGGLDAVMEEVETEIVRLAAFGGEQAWNDFASRLGAAIRQARDAAARDYDPLLDRRSFDRDRVAALLVRAFQRAGIEQEGFDEPADLEEGLWTLARDLDERLEETVLDVARRVGIEVDVDQHVEAFQCRLVLGSRLVVDALPGLDLAQERSIEGTFWRDTAVEREEIEYLATGHPVVEALVNFVRDGDMGRASVVKLRTGSAPGLAACFSFVVQLPEAEDLAQGSHVPSRQAGRLLENPLVRVGVEVGADGAPHVRDAFVAKLDEATPATVRPSDVRIPPARWEQTVRAMEAAARAAAQQRLVLAVQAAEERLDAETEKRLDRLSLDAERAEGREKLLRAAEMVQEQQFADAVRRALRASTLALDSACVLMLEPAPAAKEPAAPRRR